MGGQQLAAFCNNAFQCRVLALGGKYVFMCSPAMLHLRLTHSEQRCCRSYAIIILCVPNADSGLCERVGKAVPHVCMYMRLSGYFGGTYSVLRRQWRDHATRCSVRYSQTDESDDDDRRKIWKPEMAAASRLLSTIASYSESKCTFIVRLRNSYALYSEIKPVQIIV